MKMPSAAIETGDTKLTILRAARELIQTRSYLGLSFQELADRVGIRKASLYHHFPSKEALGIAVMARSVAQFDQWVGGLQGSPQAQLRAYVDMFRNVLGAGKRMCPGGSMGAGWETLEPGLQQAVRQVRQRQIDWLTVIFAQLATSSTPSKIRSASVPQPQAAQCAAELFALCQGALLSARMTGRPEDFDAALAPTLARWTEQAAT